MAGPLPVKGTEISSAPCSVRKAASLLRRFLSSAAALEVGIARGYVEAVSQSLEEMLARGKGNSGNSTEGLRLRTGRRSSKFFNIEQVPKIPEAKKRSRKEKEAKQKKKDQAMVDFEALLGHELDGPAMGEQADGDIGFEEKPAVSEIRPSTPRQVDSVDDGRESQKSEKRKKKRKSLVGGAMDVDMDGTQSSRKAEAGVDSDPENTKSAKKKKKRKSVDGVISNGLSSSTAKEIKVETGVARAEDEDTKPADGVRKKKKKHRGDTSQGATPMKEESEKVLTEHMTSSIGDRGINGNDSGLQQQGSVKKKSKKRSSDVSPGNFEDQHRKSKKLRLSD